MAEHLRDLGYMPEQVQDFYPTLPSRFNLHGYTGIYPRTGESVYIQRILMKKPCNALIQCKIYKKFKDLAKEALIKCGRQI